MKEKFRLMNMWMLEDIYVKVKCLNQLISG